MSNITNSRAVFLGALVLGAMLVAFLVWHQQAAPEPDVPRVVVKVMPTGAVGESGVPVTETAHREAARNDSVSVTVRSVDGQALTATLVMRDGTIVINGTGFVPMNSGIVKVTAARHESLSIDIREEPHSVVMKRVYSLRGYVFDAATRNPVVGASVTVDSQSNNSTTVTRVTDAEGSFFIERITSGRFVVSGHPVGYLPLCESPQASFPGIAIEASDDLRIEVPAFPIMLSLCSVQNLTNLHDDVFRALLKCRFSEQPGALLPTWCDRQVSNTIAEVAKAHGFMHSYGEARYLDRVSESLVGRANFVIMGQSAGVARVVFQDYGGFLRQPAFSNHVVDRQWPVGRLTVESPIVLRICEKRGIIFGGLRTNVGSCTYELPHGRYVIGPLDGNPLLDQVEWTREVEVPRQTNVVISPTAGFATLEVADAGVWRDGVLRCGGKGWTWGIPLRSLPISMPVSPGNYEFSVAIGSGAEHVVVWKGDISISAGETKVLRVGAK